MAILIVESNPSHLNQAVQILEEAGYQPVRTAASAEDAIKALEHTGEESEALPDVVFVSSELPDLSGVDCLKLIHSKPLWRDLPIVMLLEANDTASAEKAMDAGAADFVAKPLDPALLLMRLRLALSLKAETDRRKEREKELLEATQRLQEVITSLQGLSSMDTLTGLANRRQFDEAMAREWRRMLRDQQPLALILLDLDEFGAYNTRYGRPKGDEALRVIGTTLQVSFTRPADVVARLDGEKFAMVLPGISAGGVSFLAEKVRHALSKLEITHEDAPKKVLTASLGASCIKPKADLRIGFLMAAAEEALFEAKRKGGDHVEVNALGE